MGVGVKVGFILPRKHHYWLAVELFLGVDGGGRMMGGGVIVRVSL